MHSFAFIPSLPQPKLQPLDTPKPAERELPRTESSGEKSFSEHLSSRIDESGARTDRIEKKSDQASNRNESGENKDETETNRQKDTERSAEADLHRLAHAANLHALKLKPHNGKAAEKDQSKDGLAIKADGAKKKQAIASDLAQIEQGLASIIAALSSHTAAKPAAAKISASDENTLPHRAKENLLQKAALLRKQLAAVDRELTVPEEKASLKKADQFLAKLEQMLKKNSPKDFKQERFTAIGDDIKKELTAVRQAAEKHAKPRVADAAVAAAVRIDSQKTESTEAGTAASKETSAQSSIAPASTSKSDNDSQNFSFAKQAHTLKDSALSSKDISASQLKGTPFAEHVDEIISKSKMTVRDGQNGTLAFRLNPDNLGSVNISLGLENGVLSAKFLVDSAETKENLTANMNALKETLAQEGINIGQFQVDVRAGYSGHSRDSDDAQQSLNMLKISEAEKVSQEYDTVSTPSHNGVIDMKI